MPHGQPDYGMYAEKRTTYGLADMGELAARLGSLLVFDRRGDVVWVDDFNGALNKWIDWGTGAGNSQAISAELALIKDTSVKLIGGSTLTHFATIDKYLAYPVLSRFGFEFSWNLATAIDTFRILLRIRGAFGTYTSIIRYDHAAGTLSYYTHPITYVVWATPGALVTGGTLFNIWKLVVDMTTKKYVRFIHNDTEYDLSGLDPDHQVAPAPPSLQVEAQLVSRDGNNDYIYGGYAIVTQNEP